MGCCYPAYSFHWPSLVFLALGSPVKAVHIVNTAAHSQVPKGSSGNTSNSKTKEELTLCLAPVETRINHLSGTISSALSEN